MIFFLFLFLKAQAFTLANSNPDLQGWDLPTVSFDYNPANCGANFLSALSDAANIWNTAETSRIKISVGAQVGTSVAGAMSGAGLTNPTIVCDTSFTSNATLGNPSGNFYSGMGMISTQGNRINYGFIVLNADTGTLRISNLSAMSLSITIAHDMGHVLGLGHSPDPAALMNNNVSTKQKLNLSQDDIDGITYLYPRDEFKGNILGCGSIQSSKNMKSSLLLSLLLFLVPAILATILKLMCANKTPTFVKAI